MRDTKNGTKREVPLSEKAIEILRGAGALAAAAEHNRRDSVDSQQREPLSNGVQSVPHPIFNITSGSISSLFARYCQQLGIEGLTFHCLRRTAATRLAKKLTVWELCAMFGWKDPKIPMKHYYAPNVEEIARKL